LSSSEAKLYWQFGGWKNGLGGGGGGVVYAVEMAAREPPAEVCETNCASASPKLNKFTNRNFHLISIMFLHCYGIFTQSNDRVKGPIHPKGPRTP